MSKKVLIVGGGIIGICSAYFLKKDGFDVTIVDKSAMNSGASYINAGYLSPGHIIPLASPGVISQGLKWMFDSSSPFYIQPRLNFPFIKWLLAFNKSCTKKNVENSIRPIIDLSVFSQELLNQIKTENQMSFHYEKKGLMMLCKSEKSLCKEEEVVKKAVESGLSAKMLSVDDIKSIGFNIDFFGENSVVINGIPSGLDDINEKEIIEGFVEEVKNNNLDLKSQKKDIILKSFSKKAKIINNKNLSQTEMNLIIDRLFACENPKYSPDGKQNYIELGIDKVENLF